MSGSAVLKAPGSPQGLPPHSRPVIAVDREQVRTMFTYHGHGIAARWIGVLLTCTAILATCSPRVYAVTPESPEVKAVVEKAIRFLEQPLPQSLASMPNSVSPGAKSLVAMCLLKAGRKADHPLVKDAVESIRQALAMTTGTTYVSPLDVYNTGLCIVFLFELDPQTYRAEMERLTQQLISVQQKNGGWGYPGRSTGDTSMTQYGCLGLWAAENVGISVPVDSWERAANWLVRTQDPSGAFGYQGVDPGNYTRVSQNEIRHSLSAAGLGSLYICGERLRLFGSLEPEEDPNLPPALKRRKKQQSIGRGSGVVEVNRVRDTMEHGKAWLQSKYRIDPPEWCYYYLYAYERYQSFRELTPGEGKASVNWYDDGYRFLAKSQRADGAWDSPPGHNTVADTTFGILFLLRSTKKVIERAKTLGAGMLVGGRGLPGNMSEAEMRLGGFRAKKLSGPAMQLLSIIGDPEDPKFEQVVAAIEEDGIEGGDETLSEVAKRLRKLAAGQSPESRAAALRALARTRNLDEVPLLIEALKDPEPIVFSAANDGLRFISRKFYGAGFWSGIDEKIREEARKQWTEWYLSVRPNAILAE